MASITADSTLSSCYRCGQPWRIVGSRAHVTGDLALLSSHWLATATAPDVSPVQMEFPGSELARSEPVGSLALILDNPWGAV